MNTGRIMLETSLRIIGIIFPLFACTLLGTWYCKRFKPDLTAVNRLNLDVFSPLLIFWALVDKPFDPIGYLNLAVGGAVVILGSGLLLLPLVLLSRINLHTFLPPMMFNNSGNMGLPLLLFAFGPEALQPAVILLIVGMLLQFTVGVLLLDHRVNPLKMLRNPILLAAVIGLVMNITGIRLPVPVMATINMLGQVAIPLLLFALGARLLDVDMKDWQLGTFGAFAGPLVGVASAQAIMPFLHLSEFESAILIVFGALPPAVFNLLLAEQYQQEPHRVASLVLIGNLFSVIIIPVALWFTLP
ncbi:AEC family transporter [Halioxenophilus aromaticivorans]|uniref:AEC family transporter n=2 Tax=Halioxenophilus aromaticivorans TaxID=1306992 RepID=A0AAV3UA34_9ALTE